MKRRGRFAPTPSGLLHIGNAFAALSSWLQMRHCGGEFVLRIEDIDKPRSRPAFAEQCLNDLRWLGLDWDEGPDTGGRHAPYTQSKREAYYEGAIDKLSEVELLYPCYCSRSELASIASAPHGLRTEGAPYPGLCRNLSRAEQERKAMKKAPALRFKMPRGEVCFMDGITGKQCFTGEWLGDFVVKRADGMYSYQLAVTVDDAMMGITNVLRGADLLDSTPRQLALYEALRLNAPDFAHIPLIGDEDNPRLSKRDKSITLTSLHHAGIAPERIVGLLAYLAGWIDRLEPVKADELVASYHTDCLASGSLMFTPKLRAWLFDGS